MLINLKSALLGIEETEHNIPVYSREPQEG